MASWGKITYSRRLFLWLVGYSILLVVCVLLFQYKREKDFKAGELNAQLQVLNERIIHQLETGNIDINTVDVDDFKDLRVSIVDSSGQVIYDNSLDALPNTNHLRREEISEAIRFGTGYTIRRHSESTGETYFYSARKGANGIIVRTAVPYSVSLDGLLQADKGFLWFLAGLTIIMCTLGYFATRRVGLHVRRLKLFAESAEKGNKIYDDEPFPHDELGDISNHIVRLYVSLQQAISERDREHSAALHEQQEKERIKKQLTDNINHELKTPVASIQVCIETLLNHPDMGKEKRIEFLTRCLANNQRLQQLLSDVSLITRMEDGAKSIVREQIDLKEIIRNVVEERSEIAEKHGFTIQNDVVKPIEMKGSRSLWESVFFNLIDNAISYSGGNKITVTQMPSSLNKIILTLCDNGCGVAEEHLPRLFERFYRVDKGRSRAAGGTGLGLSIVKNAVQLHRGSITVSNNPNGGLCFKIILNRD
ncbi:ATP-binding protein [uncultured Bacteroides sp.]|uniref:sensor histidine kinase n=1 Tax=uncultured Bacteroides sp. TaxID=162156 RepID=UPI00262F5DC3|nr:ATP-binding protein [uncultured Bacteroides sp.]